MDNQVDQNEIRRQKGVQIAQTCRILRREKGGFVVPSQSGDGCYIVRYENMKHTCECPDFEKKGVLGIQCKHIWAVRITIQKLTDAEGNTIVKSVKISYPQDWSSYDKAKTIEKTMFMKLLNDLCKEVQTPSYKFGRPKLNYPDLVFASALKIYTTFSLRRFQSDMRDAKDKGLIDTSPCYASVGHFMQKEELTPILLDLIEKSAMPLRTVETQFAIDSSGFSTSRFERWFSFKHGRKISNRIWVKAHICCGTKTNVISAIKITESSGADSPQFKELVDKTAENFDIKELSADKAYIGVENLETVVNHGGTPYIPFKSNTAINKSKPKIWKKMYHYFMLHREEFLQHYHQRSNSETVFHMVKSKFGDYVRSKTWTAQRNEVLLKFLCHNLSVVIQEMHELGIIPKFYTENGENNSKESGTYGQL